MTEPTQKHSWRCWPLSAARRETRWWRIRPIWGISPPSPPHAARRRHSATPHCCRLTWPGPHNVGLSARTAARRLSVLRQFHRFLLSEGVRADDPTTLLDAPRLPRMLPKYLTEHEVEALLDAAKCIPGQRGALARAALEISTRPDCGCRSSWHCHAAHWPVMRRCC